MKYELFLLVNLSILPGVAGSGWTLPPSFSSPTFLNGEYPLTPFQRRQTSPRYEIRDNDEKFQVALDIPGLKLEDIDMHLDDSGRFLVISGHREASGEAYSFSSDWLHSFPLDPAVQAGYIHAELENGVLLVSAPKDHLVKRRRSTSFARELIADLGNQSLMAGGWILQVPGV